MPTINGRVNKQTFQGVSDRFDKRLAGWRGKILSLARRATLVSSTMATIPFYAMQTAKLPRSLCDDCDKKARLFLWGGDANIRKIHNVSWEKLLQKKEEGGLGFKSMRHANIAFMTKLGWRLMSEKDSLWSKVIRAKYCQDRCDIDMFTHKQDASNVWHGITESAQYIK